MTLGSSLFYLVEVNIHFRRTLSAGLATASSTSKNSLLLRLLVAKKMCKYIAHLFACGVFSSCTCRFAFDAENICYSRWSRRLPLQTTLSSLFSKQTIIHGNNVQMEREKKILFLDIRNLLNTLFRVSEPILCHKFI